MKKYFKSAMLIAAAAMAFTACSDVIDEGGIEAPEKTVKLTISTAADTRTMVENDTTPLWLPTDQIGVSINLEGQEQTAFANDNKQESSYQTSFSGTLTATEGPVTVYTYYPYSNDGSNNGFINSDIRAYLPATQHPTATSFDGAADILIGKPFEANLSGDTKFDGLQFKRESAFLKIELVDQTTGTVLSEQNLKDFKLTASSNLVGYIKLNLVNGTSEAPYSKQENSVKAEYDEDTQFAIGQGAVYLGVYPQTISGTLTISATTDSYSIYREVSLPSDLTLSAGIITSLKIGVKDDNIESTDVVNVFESDEIFVCTKSVTASPAAGFGDNATFNGKKATGFKIGSSNNTGEFESQPVNVSGDYTLSLYGVAWAGKTSTLKISVNNGGYVAGPDSYELRGDEGATGNTGNYTITVSEDDKYEFPLFGLTEKSTITFTTTTSGSDKRVIAAGIHLTEGATPKPTISVDTESLTFEADDTQAQTVKLNVINPNNETVTATLSGDNADKFTATLAGDYSTVTVAPKTVNETQEALTATLTVALGSITRTVEITQKAAPAGETPAYYQKVTATNDITDGEYLIVCESKNVALNGNLTSSEIGNSNTIAVTIANSKIESNSTTDAAAFAIQASGNGYTIKSLSQGFYIGHTGSKNTLDTNTTGYTNTITISNGNATIDAGSSYKLQYNSSSSFFRYYTSNQTAIQLYKKIGDGSQGGGSKPTITPTTSTATIKAGETTATVDLTVSDGDVSNCTSSENWLNASYKDGKVTLTATGTSTAQRTATVTVTATNSAGSTDATINVTQEATQQGSGETGGTTTYIDKLTSANTNTSSSYSDWTLSNSNNNVNSDATYAGHSCTQTSNIQINSSKSTYGIVTTKSGGKVKSITINIKSINSGKTLDIYGKNVAYTGVKDTQKGTLIKSLSGTGTQTVTVSDDYEFIGIVSNTGAIQMSDITIVWEK